MPPEGDILMTSKTNARSNEAIPDAATFRRHASLKKWCPITNPKFRIGIIVGGNEGPGDHLLALPNPASMCCATALTFLHPEKVNMKEWCVKHRVDGVPRVDDLDMLLNNPTIDGVYITGAAE